MNAIEKQVLTNHPTKWFYPAQSEVEEKMKLLFLDWACSFQQITKDRVTEFYNTKEAGGILSQCIVTIFKVKTSLKYRVMIYKAQFIGSIN